MNKKETSLNKEFINLMTFVKRYINYNKTKQNI